MYFREYIIHLRAREEISVANALDVRCPQLWVETKAAGARSSSEPRRLLQPQRVFTAQALRHDAVLMADYDNIRRRRVVCVGRAGQVSLSALLFFY